MNRPTAFLPTDSRERDSGICEAAPTSVNHQSHRDLIGRGRRSRAAFIALVIGGVCGCSYTYAPPLRTTSRGLPEHISGGNLEVGVAASSFANRINAVALAPELALGLTDWLMIEGGADWGPEVVGHSRITGYGGVRISPLYFSENRGNRFVFDIGLGGGAGLGGSICDDRPAPQPVESSETESDCYFCFEPPPCEDWDGLHWLDRLVYGGYFDVGLGVKFTNFFGLHIRPRVQMMGGDTLPTTLWFDTIVAAHFSVARFLEIYAGGGVWFFVNDEDWSLGAEATIGVAFRYDLF